MNYLLAQADVENVTGIGEAAGTTLDPATALAISAGIWLVIILAIIWSFIWKGIALWKAARNGAKVWYVVLLLVNTLGILEIIYIFAIAKKTEVVQGPQTPPMTTPQV